MFAEVSSEESERLQNLIKGIKTEEDAVKIFGEPTRVLEPGGRHTEPEKGDAPAYIHLYRTLRYEAVSDSAVVDIHVDQNGRVFISLFGKYLGKSPKT